MTSAPPPEGEGDRLLLIVVVLVGTVRSTTLLSVVKVLLAAPFEPAALAAYIELIRENTYSSKALLPVIVLLTEIPTAYSSFIDRPIKGLQLG
jgi:hypothetical protein